IRERHRFWDRENGWLFAGVGAARTLDYFSTLNMRQRGRQEIFLSNGVVDNHLAFATIEAAATGASIGASFLFHRYGHHKLERWKFRHRFTLLLCALIFFLLAPDRSANPQQLSQDNTPQPSAQLPPRHEIPPLVTGTPEQTRTEQYTLSHERYEKAVAYSRA